MARRHRYCSSVAIPSTMGSETLYARKQVASWLLRLLDNSVSYDDNLFLCVAWCMGGSTPFAKELQKVLAKMPQKADVSTVLDTVQEDPPNSLPRALEMLADNNATLHGVLRESIQVLCHNIVTKKTTAKANNSKSPFLTTQKQLKSTFGIDKHAYSFCEFVFLLQSYPVIERYFEDTLEVFKAHQRYTLAHMLNMPLSQLHNSKKYLNLIGVIEEKSYAPRINDAFLTFWEDPSPSMASLFCRSLDKKTLPLDSYFIDNDKIGHALSLFQCDDANPKHILLYGYAGTGKTSFAKSLVNELGVKGWAVTSREDDDESSRRTSLMACLHMSKKHEKSIVLVDEAERLLDTGSHFLWRTKDKAWLNDLLEQSDKRIIWITNDIGHIDQAVRRRFTYSIYFDKFDSQKRSQVLAQLIARHKLAKLLTKDMVTSLQSYDVPVAVMEQAFTQNKAIHKKSAPLFQGIKGSLDAYLTLRNNGKMVTQKVEVAEDYALDGVSIDGHADALLEKCLRVDALMRSEDKPRIPAGAATMLFYGVAGSGKTALARHLAHVMQRECLVKRASDLLSKYVGEAEKNIAAAFREAESKGAVLVIDEADSFLQGRENARHSWEITQVNEFLTALEECRSFCICTTNRRENLDSAAIRRFSHKVCFTYAKAPQLMALYESILRPLCKTKLSEAQSQRLTAFSRLTAGDFHAVKMQYSSLFVDSAKVTHQLLLDALQKEQDLKLEVTTKRVGFMG